MRIQNLTLPAIVLFITACGGGGDGDGGGTTGDTTAPSAPGAVTVAAISSTSIGISWQAANDDTGVVGYRIYRDGTLAKSVSATTTDDAGLVTGVNYCYEVSAYDAANNESTRSASLCATPANVWTQRVPAADIVVNAIVHNGTGYLALGDPSDSTNYVFTSDDGLVWATHSTQVLRFQDAIWTGTQYVAASGSSFYYTSANGIDWTTSVFPTTSIDYNAIAWSGSVAVVVGEDGIVSSTTDDIDWTDYTGITTAYLNDIEWLNNRFVAVGGNGTVLFSTDGSNWTSESTGTTDSLSAIAWNGSTYVAMSSSGAFTSSDGITWAPVVVSGLFEDLVWADALNLFVAVEFNGVVVTSPDGISWTVQTDPGQFPSLISILWDGTKLIAGGSSGEIATSSDGINWVTRASAMDFDRVRWDGTTLYGVGGFSKLATSSDGIRWSFHHTGYRGDYMHDIANSGSRLLAAAQTYYMSTTPDLVAPWPAHDWIGATTQDFGVVWDGTQFVSVGTSGGMRVSTDGINYTYIGSAVTGTTDVLREIIHTGTQYVVVGNSGTVLTAPDLANWSVQTSGTSNTLYSVAYSGNTYVAVGGGGTILLSSDAINWSAATSNTASMLLGVTWAADEFVAVGAGTAVLTSPDGVTWTESTDALAFNRYYGAAYNGSRLIVVGDNGAILTREK